MDSSKKRETTAVIRAGGCAHDFFHAICTQALCVLNLALVVFAPPAAIVYMHAKNAMQMKTTPCDFLVFAEYKCITMVLDALKQTQ